MSTRDFPQPPHRAAAALRATGDDAGRLVFSLSLGTAGSLIPILGVSTALCAVVAVILKLNMPAIQLVNYLLTPLQLILVIPRCVSASCW